jgi:hypothetical protein
MSDKDKPKSQIVLEALLVLAVNLASVWAILPPDQRMWLRLRWCQTLRRVLGGLAVREGRAGMADELAGRDPAPRYSAAFCLAALRDRLR